MWNTFVPLNVFRFNGAWRAKPLMLLVFGLLALAGCEPASDPVHRLEMINLITRVEQSANATGRDQLVLLNDTLNNKDLHPLDQMEVYAFKYNHHLNRHRYLSASRVVDSMFMLIRRHPFVGKAKGWDSYTMVAKADIYMKVGRVSEAMDMYAQAADRSKEAGDLFRAATLYYRAAMSDYAQQNFSSSAHHFRIASVLSAGSDTNFAKFYFRQEVINNQGLSFERMARYDSALFYYRAAQEYLATNAKKYQREKRSIYQARAVTALHLGSVFEKIGAADSALAVYDLAMEFYSKGNWDTTDIRNLHYRIAEVLRSKGKLDEALIWVKPGSLYQTSSNDLLLRQLRFNAAYYADIKDYRESNRWLQAYNKAADSIRLTSLCEPPVNLAEGITLLQAENRATANAKDRQILLLTVLSLGLLLLLAVFAGLRLRRLLKDKSKKAEESFKEMEVAKQEHHAIAKKMKQQEIHFDALMSNVDDYLWVVDRDQKLVSFNGAYQAFTEAAFGESLQIGGDEPRMHKRGPYRDKWVKAYEAALAGNTVHWMDKGISVKGYSPTVEYKLFPVYDDDRQVIGVSCMRKDVTEVLERLQQIERQNKRLREIAWMQSHHARSPVANLLGLVNLFESPAIQEDEKKKIIGYIQTETERLDEIIREITKTISEETNGIDH